MLLMRRTFGCSEAELTGGESAPRGVVKALARDVDELESLGLRNMAWRSESDSAFAPQVLNLDWLACQRDLPFLVPVIPASVLHRSLVAHGLEDSIEIIEHLKSRQLVRVLDHDLWEVDSESGLEDISTSRALSWMRCWLEIGREFTASRIFELEEETLVLLFSKLLDVQPEGIGRQDVAHADDYWTTQDGRFHLRVKSPDPEAFEIIKLCVDSMFEADIRFAGSILSVTAMTVRCEAAELAERWRKGRLADEGFVDRAEGLEALRHRDVKTIQSELPLALSRETSVQSSISSTFITGFHSEDLEEIEADIRAALLAHEPREALQIMEGAAGDDELKLISASQIANPEVLLDDDDLIEETSKALAARAARLLWQGEAAQARRFATHRILLERVMASLAEGDASFAAHLKARLARLTNTFVAGTAPQADADALGRALSVVRGSLNIGLETILNRTEEFSLNLSPGSELERAVEALRKVGPEYCFQLGWSLLGELAGSLCEALDSDGRIRLPSQPLLQSWKRGHLVEIRRWLAMREADLPHGIHHVLASLLNRVPLFPEILASTEGVKSATRQRRAFESIEDMESASRFVAGFHRLELE